MRPCGTCTELGFEAQLTCIPPGRRFTACDDCRSLGKKCSRGRPRCDRCTKRGATCSWTGKPKHRNVPRKRADTVSQTAGERGSSLMDFTGTELPEDGITADTNREMASSGYQSRIGESSAVQTTVGASQSAAEEPRQGTSDAWEIGRRRALEAVDDEDLVEDPV
jgi:hypothetical protein